MYSQKISYTFKLNSEMTNYIIHKASEKSFRLLNVLDLDVSVKLDFENKAKSKESNAK